MHTNSYSGLRLIDAESQFAWQDTLNISKVLRFSKSYGNVYGVPKEEWWMNNYTFFSKFFGILKMMHKSFWDIL